MDYPRNLRELRASRYQTLSVKDELRLNLIRKLRAGQKLFPGIVGYDDTVIPQLVNAILSRHNIILLGLRGQAKSRIIRQITELLDEHIPIIAGSEVNDDPFRPISAYGRRMLAVEGEMTPIDWIDRDARFVEKLATPDVTVADIIGDVDPIKAAKGGHLLSDELTIHYGLLPRANRGIFAINELPDLAGKIQVALFNIMQEGDVQIKGYPVRLPLDVMLMFSANPEDYTARGKIITPLKDRIGSEITTHYPKELPTARRDHASGGVDGTFRRPRAGSLSRILFARSSSRLHSKLAKTITSTSIRVFRSDMPITVMESVVSNAERRSLLTGEEPIVPRIADVYAAIPSMTGKMELEYEGEQLGANRIARDLIKRAAGEIFEGYFVGIDFSRTVQWFDEGNKLLLADTAAATECAGLIEAVPELLEAALIPFEFDRS